jgi:hypothetical protein
MKLELHTAGSAQGNLVCSSVSSWCGDIKCGIALQFVDYPFSYIVDFDDFEKVYLLAKAYREIHSDVVNKELEDLS